MVQYTRSRFYNRQATWGEIKNLYKTEEDELSNDEIATIIGHSMIIITFLIYTILLSHHLI